MTTPADAGSHTTGVAWFDSLRDALARFPLSVILLAGRIGVGAVFFKAGLLKYNSWEFAVKLFEEEYKVPLLDPSLAARLALTQELTIPILLFLGLATRLATIPLLGMIAVIQTFVYPNAYNDHLVWGSILVLVLTRGPGVFSLDYLIERRVRRGHPCDDPRPTSVPVQGGPPTCRFSPHWVTTTRCRTLSPSSTPAQGDR